MTHHKELALAEGQVSYNTSLPGSGSLPIGYLAACFGSVSTSYKYYWCLALLAEAQGHDAKIPMSRLLARMLSDAWYPINQFRLNFGKQDQLGKVVRALREVPNLTNAPEADTIAQQVQSLLSGDAYPDLKPDVNKLANYVPYRFLRPWFAQELRGMAGHKVNNAIKALAEERFVQKSVSLPIYKFNQDAKSIELHPLWHAYLQQHASIIRGFCLWNLVQYLQKNNPNTPGISEKLFAPQERKMNRAKKFWKLAFVHAPAPLRCIYSGQDLTIDDHSIDHFLPWSFVTHDLLWNLLPVPKSVNSSKSNNIPDLDRYCDPLAGLQFNALQSAIPHASPQLLEDYIILTNTNDLQSLLAQGIDAFTQKLRDTIAPQAQIAANMGFSSKWVYKHEAAE